VKKITIASALSLLLLSAGAVKAEEGDVNAEIVAAITITQTVGLQFGQIAPTASAGTVTLTTAGGLSSSNVTLAGLIPTTAASFDVAGAPDNTYALTVDATATIDFTTESMTVDLVSSPVATGTLDGDGEDIVLVGGTLHVGANQVAGEYEGTYDISVAYN
jgi:hypothetical protein